MEEFFKAISNYGFPIVISGYLLLRFEKKIEQLTEKIGDLADIIGDKQKSDK